MKYDILEAVEKYFDYFQVCALSVFFFTSQHYKA